jgi:hypothetical protein
MVVTQTRRSRSAGKPSSPWSLPSQFHRSLPLLRLITTIAAISEVIKIEILVDGAGTNVHVVLRSDLREGAHAIFHAERDYLNATMLHSFDLNITPIGRVPAGILEEYALAGYEVVFERGIGH